MMCTELIGLADQSENLPEMTVLSSPEKQQTFFDQKIMRLGLGQLIHLKMKNPIVDFILNSSNIGSSPSSHSFNQN